MKKAYSYQSKSEKLDEELLLNRADNENAVDSVLAEDVEESKSVKE